MGIGNVSNISFGQIYTPQVCPKRKRAPSYLFKVILHSHKYLVYWYFRMNKVPRLDILHHLYTFSWPEDCCIVGI
jgi:hypothetical protein